MKLLFHMPLEADPGGWQRLVGKYLPFFNEFMRSNWVVSEF